MIWYVLTKFQNKEKENRENLIRKIKRLSPGIPLFILFAVLNLFAIVRDSFILSGIGYFALIFLGLTLIQFVNKKLVEGVDELLVIS